MNKKKICILLLTCMVLSCAFALTACSGSGESNVPERLVSENVEVAQVTPGSVSMGLDVIAEQKDMAIAGVKGNILNFSAERFACAMNLSRIDSVTVISLPDSLCGSLYLGSETVSEGQKLNERDLSLLTYEESENGIGRANSFDFCVNDSSYAVTCNIYMIDEVNYSPTVSLASLASLNLETYKNIQTAGVLSAYDPEGDSLTFEIVRYPANGQVILTDATVGRYVYTPNEGYTGEDSFRYVAFDKYGNCSAWEEVKLTVAAQSSSAVYRDLLDSELHVHAIAMTENGIMNGVQVGDHYYFEPEREVSRAEFLVTAMNAVGIKNLPDVTKTVFADDAQINSEMKSYVALAYEKGYISGKTVNGKLCFAPNETIKLSEAAVIISNMIGYAEAKYTPVFADAVPSWSEKAIESLYTLGVLEMPDMVSGAGESVTRGEMAKLLNKAMFVIGR